MATVENSTTRTIIEVLGDNNTDIVSKTVNPGFLISENQLSKGSQTREKIQKEVFTLSGRIKTGQSKKIGTISFSAEQVAANKYFKTPPYLLADNENSDTKNRVRLQRSNVTRDDNKNIIKYTYDLIYESNDFENSKKLNYTIKEQVSDKLEENTADEKLKSISVGSTVIYSNGEKRKITVIGDPGTIFRYTITKLTDVKDSDGVVTDYLEESVISASSLIGVDSYKSYSSNALGKSGETQKYLAVKIPSSGTFSFFHVFPPATSETRYVFRADKEITNATKEAFFNEDNGWFQSSGELEGRTKYGISRNVLYGKGWSDWMYKIITQVVNPAIRFDLTGTWTQGHLTLTSSDGRYSSFSMASSGNPWTVSSYQYRGRYNTRSTDIKENSVFKSKTFTYTFLASSGSFALRSGSDGAGGTLGNPIFGRSHSSESDWTNTIPYDTPPEESSIEEVIAAEGKTGNGGTEVVITGVSSVISTTSSSNDTITITYTVNLEKWGTKDVIMSLDTSKIATLS
jgi:hypothetical protein